MFKLSFRKTKSGRSKNSDRPLLKSSKKSPGKNLKIKIFKRRELKISFSKSKEPGTKRPDKTTKLIVSFYLFSRFREIKLSYKKQPYRGLRYSNSLNPSYLLSVVLVFIGLGGLLYFTLDIQKPYEIKPINTIDLPVSEILQEPSQSDEYLSYSKPTHIKIKSAGIDYPIMEVGQKKDGTMETPPLFEKVTGWYKYGPSPGEAGPAIIVGHVDTYKGPSVFWGLRELKADDVITITRKDDSIVKFKVTGLQQFSQNDFPTKKVYGNTDKPELRLITCGGIFNKQTLRYSDNTVVFASIIESNNS